ncbi:hypothetical protein Tco_1425107, partial [Tanacetum coccineum]
MLIRHTTLLPLERKLQNQSTFERKLILSHLPNRSLFTTKGTKLKTKAKVAKSDKKKQLAKKPKAKGLAVLSEFALTEDKQLKLATKRSKTQFHSSYASGSGVPDVPKYDSESDKEYWGDSDEEDDDVDDFEDDAD